MPASATGAAGVTSRCCAVAGVSLGSVSGAVGTPSSVASGVITTAAPSGRGGIADRWQPTARPPSAIPTRNAPRTAAQSAEVAALASRG